VLFAADWVYLATYIAISTGGLLHHPFTLTKKNLAVYSLLHLPLGYPSHQLDGILPCSSPDFPLEKIKQLSVIPSALLYHNLIFLVSSGIIYQKILRSKLEKS